MIMNFKSLFLNKKLFALVSSILVISFLLSSTVSFADNNEDLLKAISQNNLEDVKEFLNDPSIDFRNINRFDNFPSLEMSELLLENGERSLGSNKFLDLVLEKDCRKYDSKKSSFEVRDELIEQRNKLVELALDKGANSTRLLEISVNKNLPLNNNTYRSITLPRSDILLKMALRRGANFSTVEISLDPNKFLESIMHSSCQKWNSEKQISEVDDELVKQKKKLIELALEKG